MYTMSTFKEVLKRHENDDTLSVSIRLLLRGRSCEISYQSHSPTKKSKEFTLNRRVIDELFTLTY